MKKRKKHQKGLIPPHNSNFADRPEVFDTSGEYLNFASNGMTDNEKIDEYNYYDEYLDVDTVDDIF